MKRYLMFLWCFAFVSINAQDALYKSDAFTILPDKIIQGEFKAEALSPNEITSNYKSSYKQQTNRRITFKFCINGLDNENPAGTDHVYIITPTNGRDTTMIYAFGKPDPVNYSSYTSQPLSEKTELLFRLDMKNVLKDLNEKGYYQFHDGSKIKQEEFKGVYLAGSVHPLSWDFEKLPSMNNTRLEDPDNDGIYEIKITFNTQYSPEEQSKTSWKLNTDISAYPSYKSPHLLADALYNMSLEEMIADIREDGAFMAGIKWPGVWTRDVSYSIILALAAVHPDASKTSLMAKVKNKKIIQDTGTGGSWPVSSDRMVWALAAWEIYKVTGDKSWLKESFEIIKNSAEDDLLTLADPETGLFNGESSFLDWREETYPAWMDPKDIYVSKNLGTNAVHYQTYIILSEMATLLNEPADKYIKTAESIKEAVNKYLWFSDKGYYAQFLYGRNYLALSPKSEALGEALSVLFGISNEDISSAVIQNTPTAKFGIPCVYPQIPGIPPYHNDAIWPFVEAYWGWAAAKTGNTKSVEKSIASIYRAAGLFLTNKENFVSSTGDYLGTEINSDRQLWSVAGNLATVYRIIFGMSFLNDKLLFTPFVPENYKGERSLKNFKYRNGILDIEMSGYGSGISSFTIDGKEVKEYFVPADLSGRHTVRIILNNTSENESKINITDDYFTLAAPAAKISGEKLEWNLVNGSVNYKIYRNGKESAETKDTIYIINEDSYSLWQVLAVDKNGYASFLSEPVETTPPGGIITTEAELNNKINTLYKGYSGDGYIFTEMNTGDITISMNVKEDGKYFYDLRYANGNGPVNTNNKCCIRSLFVNEERQGAIVMPQRGENNWTSWGFTNSLLLNLKKGNNKFILRFTESDNNMNYDTNSAAIDYVRLVKAE